MNQEFSPLQDFDGTVRLFPLPNLVLYPHVIQPLHIFEPRYRQMTRDALDSDRLLAVAVLEPGWEKDYLEKPPICPVICIAHIEADQALEDGRFNLLVRGVSRARIVEEIATDRMYRIARVELLDEIAMTDADREQDLRKEVLKLLPDWFSGQPAVLTQFLKLLKSDVALSTFCDIVSFALPLSVEHKQLLLAELDVERRVILLLQRLQKKRHRFPMSFSDN